MTRYFGGIKLGGGGLIRAYSGAVRDVIFAVGRVELRDAIPVIVTVAYDLTGKFEYELASTSYMLRDTTYLDKVSYHIDVIADDYDAFIAFLNQHTAGNYTLTTEKRKVTFRYFYKLKATQPETILYIRLNSLFLFMFMVMVLLGN